MILVAGCQNFILTINYRKINKIINLIIYLQVTHLDPILFQLKNYYCKNQTFIEIHYFIGIYFID